MNLLSAPTSALAFRISMNLYTKLQKKIKTKKVIIGIVGMGYVGTDLALAASKSFTVIGFDIDPKRIKVINALKNPKLRATSDKSELPTCDIIAICVTTPLHQNQTPNTTILETAAKQISKQLRLGQLIILESSVAPGMTRNLLTKTLETSGLVAGKDFWVSFSPERVDPNNKTFTFQTIPKVVSGLDKQSLRLAQSFYSMFVNKVVPVSSLEVAEMSKIVENTFRLVNISLMNELAHFTQATGINIWEVIHASSTKPFGFLAHYPGPGAGGYCIPILPHYLLEAAQKQHIALPLLLQAIKINNTQPSTIAQMAIRILKSNRKKPQKSHALIIGIGYKPEITDARESVALKIWNALEKQGIRVSYHDPFIKTVNNISSVPITKAGLTKYDVIIIITAHRKLPYQLIVRSGQPILDTRNCLKKYKEKNIVRL